MKFEEIQNPEDLKRFFTEKKFKIQEHDNLIKIDNLHYIKFEILNELDHRISAQKLREFKNRYKTEVQYLLLVDKPFQRFFFLRDYGTPIKFTYDKTRDYAPETEGALSKKLNGMRYSNSDFNESINNLFDVKEIVKKFYEEYKGIKSKLANAITNLDGNPYLYAQIILDRIIFLYFLQTKGVLAKNYLSDFYSSKKRSENYYRDYLKPLFFKILNTEHDPMSERIINGINFGRVPYLNGGLFSEKDIEINNPDIQIKDSVWKHIFNLLNSYEWVIEEEKGDSTTLTPSILGHIYEKSVIAATQKETGSYYTPEEITTYISKNTIYPYITDRINEKFNTNYKNIWNELLNKKEYTKEEIEIIRYLYFGILKKLTVLDNACGSGAFLIAAQQILMHIYSKCIFALKNEDFFYAELEKIRRNKSRNYYIKKTIITSNLYGVDIQDGAVEIAKLRLWLSMVSEMELDLKDIEPLPNIDYNILCGNSLIGFVEPPTSEQIGLYDTKTVKDIMRARVDLIEIYKGATASKEVRKLKDDIERMNQLRDELDKKLLLEFRQKKIDISEEELKKLNPFHWGFEFYDVFERGGFDIIIGNPPYGNILKKEEKEWINKNYIFNNHWDIYTSFIDRTFQTIREYGLLGFIIPASWQTGIRYANLRNCILGDYELILTINLPFNVFQTAYVDNCISIFRKVSPDNDYRVRIHSFPKKGNIKELSKLRIEPIGYNRILSDKNKRIFPNPKIYSLLDHINNYCEHTQLGKVTNSTIGILASKYKFSDAKQDISLLPYLEGDVYRYITRLDTRRYINFKKHLHDKNYLNYYLSGRKILIRRIVNREDRIMCSLSESSGVVKKDLYVFIPTTEDFDLFYLLTILNSRIVSYVYVNKSTIAIKDDFRQTTLNELRELPIPSIAKQLQQPFIHLCNYMLFLNKTEERRKSEKELIEFIDRQIIDSLVYELYFKEELKTNLLELVEPYLKETDHLDEIREIVDEIKSDRKVMETIDEIKNHEWVKVIERSKAQTLGRCRALNLLKEYKL